MNFEKLEALMETLPSVGIPCGDVAITKDGKEAFRKLVGYADAEKTKPLAKDNIYYIWSCSKIITCILTMRLIEEGKLSLSDPVSKYLPEFERLFVMDPTTKKPVPAKNTLTVEHCFTMTGGFSYDYKTPNMLYAAAQPSADTQSIIRALAREPLYFEPGTQFKYSLCHDILPAICEVITGEKFNDYAHRVLFDPLSLKHISYRLQDLDANKLVQQYTYCSQVGVSTPIPTENDMMITPDYASGGAGVVTTVDDYLAVITMLSLGGTATNGYRFLKPETVASFRENRLPFDVRKTFWSGRLYGYGWGLCGRVHMDPNMSFSKSPVGEFGWDGAAGAFNIIDDQNKIALYFGMSVKNCSFAHIMLHSQIRNLCYEGIFGN